MVQKHNDLSPRERRMAENEVFYREQNEQVQKELDKVNELAEELDAKPLKFDAAHPLHFHCECADEHCEAKVKLSLDKYNKIHERRDAFVIAKGHETPRIEEVAVKTPTYEVVRKISMPPPHVNKLQNTSL